VGQQKLANIFYIDGRAYDSARRGAGLGAQQDAGKKGARMGIDGVSRLRRHFLWLKAEVSQLAAGGITIGQHQVVQPIDQPAAGMQNQIRLQGSRRRCFQDKLLQLFGYKCFRFRIT
jgi:hypothetical protein